MEGKLTRPQHMFARHCHAQVDRPLSQPDRGRHGRKIAGRATWYAERIVLVGRYRGRSYPDAAGARRPPP